LFSLYVFYIKEETTFLKVALSINHRTEDFLAKIEADLGIEYKSASSPKPSPGLITPFYYPLTYTISSPYLRIKNELALSFCFIRYCF
jgi:hypothetical protein